MPGLPGLLSWLPLSLRASACNGERLSVDSAVLPRGRLNTALRFPPPFSKRILMAAPDPGFPCVFPGVAGSSPSPLMTAPSTSASGSASLTRREASASYPPTESLNS